MAYTRLDLRTLVRRELSDTGAPPFWSDAQLHDDLQAAFQAYSQYFPSAATGAFTSGANQTMLLFGTAALSVAAVVIDGVTVPQVPDQATLYADGQSTEAWRSHSRAWTTGASKSSVNPRSAIAVVSMCGVRGDPNTIPLPAFHPP